MAPLPGIERIGQIAIPVTDLERAVAFYSNALGLRLLFRAPPGLAFFDLANVGSAVHVLTEDLGVAEGEGFRLLGRAAGAELRGCSLVVEELQRAPNAQ